MCADSGKIDGVGDGKGCVYVQTKIKRWVEGRSYDDIHSYTLHTLCTCCSQSELTIFKMRERSTCALFLYNIRQNTFRTRKCSVRVHYARVIFNNFFELIEMSYLSHIKTTKVYYVVYKLD